MFDLEAAMVADVQLYRLEESKTETYFCELTPEQEPRQRALAQQIGAEKRALHEEEDEIKDRLKAIKTRLKTLDDRILTMNEALNYMPPKGRFLFTGALVASVPLRRAWLVDPDSGRPIVETCHELSTSEMARINEIQTRGEQLEMDFADQAEAQPADQAEAQPEQLELPTPFTNPDGTTPEQTEKKKRKKADPNPDLA
jgi:hypothetical protein